MTENHQKYLQEAIRLALENVPTGKGGPFGAIVVKDGKVIGKGVNQVTSLHDPTAHAEIVAIRDACKSLGTFQLEGCIIYSSCEPCPMCLGAIYWARPSKLVFAALHSDAAKAGFDDSYIYEELLLPYQQRDLKTLHIAPDNFFEPFKRWIESEKKEPY